MPSNYQERLEAICRTENAYYSNSIDLIAPSSFLRQELVNLPEIIIHRSMEGLLEKRPYAGTKYINEIENLGVEVAKEVFGAEHVNLQPHSGSQANQAAFAAFLNPRDKVLSMKFDAGGHLTHGNPVNFSGRFYRFEFYGVDNETQQIDYDLIQERAKEILPKMIVVGATSYPKIIDYERMRTIANENGAYLMADISHPIGLIAANEYPSPIGIADVVTGCTGKTLLGPHGGIIMGKDIYKKEIDKAVHPGVQSSVPIDRIVQVCKSIIYTQTGEYKQTMRQIKRNAKELEEVFEKIPNCLLFGGTDCHFIVINVADGFGVTGKTAEKLLEDLGIFTNRQVIPNDKNSVYITSGLRIGTVSPTQRGLKENNFREIGDIIVESLKNHDSLEIQSKLKYKVSEIIKKMKPVDNC